VLSVAGLTKRFGSVVAVDDLSFEVEAGHLYTLLGPSGCGKSTTLRSIAGLEHPDAGRIEVAARVLFSSANRVSVPANARRLGMVFQSYGLWPHLSVERTVSFPLEVGPRRGRPPREEVRRRVERVLAVVQLSGLEDRRPAELSGGQQQRLALARALVMEPPLLLMDEPLSNLDAQLREDMRLEVKRLQRELGVTSVYVTHDQAEALALSNRVAVMRDGRIEQVGRPREIYERPGSRFVAEFMGNPNLIAGTVESDGIVATAHGPLRAETSGRRPGARVVLAVHPERLTLREAAPEGDPLHPNELRGTVVNRAFHGDTVEHVIRVGSQELRARCDSSTSIPQGTEVAVGLPPESCRLIDD
jgi:iron(III) transport system ATP-binding protein